MIMMNFSVVVVCVCVCMCVYDDACLIADCMDGYVCVYLCAIEK